MNPQRRAVIDIGTNSIKLLVGEVHDGIVRPLDERSEQTRLGAGFYETHILQPVTIERTASAVAKFSAYAGEQDAAVIRVIATSAARDAKNPDDLVDAVRRASGLRVEIISGDQEAEWVYRGVTSDERFHGKPLLILDVGGGSTELILGDQERHQFRHSFPLGSVRLLEKLRPHDPPSIQDLAGCREWLQKFSAHQLGPAMKSTFTEAVRRQVTLVGTGGTTTILARMEKQLTQFTREDIDGVCLTRQRILDYMVHLWSLPLSERRKIAGLPGNRADVIIMGVAIYEAIMQHFGLQELHVSTRGLRFGALLDPPMNVADARDEVLALMQALEEEPHHVLHVAALAVQLFDELEDLHGLGDHDRLILEAAALLHDIGWCVAHDGPGHHRESARLIRQHGWKHLGAETVELTAQVARYHRKSPPDLEHEEFAALSPAERHRVQQLAALLRIADGLDRGHQRHVTGVSAEILSDTLVIRLHSSHPCSREIGSAAKKADLATVVFRRAVTFVVVPESRP